ncbi:MAG: hypothetical protein ABIK65_15520 [Candidatus Eisenbacteria bacterium]
MNVFSRGWIPVVSLLLLSFACGGGDGEGDDNPAGPSGDSFVDSLVVSRSDGSMVNLAEGAVCWCGDWEEGTVPIPTIHVNAGINLSRPWEADGGLTVQAVLADVVLGETLSVANDFVWDAPEGVLVFLKEDVFDLNSPEYASWVSNTRGTIVFEKLLCGPGGTVRFAIDAVIGLEADGSDSVSIVGVYEAPVEEMPVF